MYININAYKVLLQVTLLCAVKLRTSTISLSYIAECTNKNMYINKLYLCYQCNWKKQSLKLIAIRFLYLILATVRPGSRRREVDLVDLEVSKSSQVKSSR